MKIGFLGGRTDLGLKHAVFEINGERHWVLFRFSHRKGITEPFVFDGHGAKIIDAYPPLHKLIRQAVSITWGRARWAIRKSFVQKGRNGTKQHGSSHGRERRESNMEGQRNTSNHKAIQTASNKKYSADSWSCWQSILARKMEADKFRLARGR